MTMMQIGKVGMVVTQSPMGVLVRMRFTPVPVKVVLVLVMLVVHVPMRVQHRLVFVDVRMALSQVQP